MGSKTLIKEQFDCLKHSILKDSSIILMGRLEHVDMMIEWLQNRGFHIIGIFDNDVNKQGGKVKGIAISAPRKAADVIAGHGDIQIIIYSPKYWEIMVEQLGCLGYEDGRQIIVLDRPTLGGNIDKVKQGYDIYCNLQRRYGQDVQVFLVNGPLGDFYMLGLFFNAYCEKNRIENYVVVGDSEGIHKLADMFHISPSLKITLRESDALIRAWIFLGDKMRMKPLTSWQGAFRFNPPVARQKPPFSFTDTFRYLIYNLAEGSLPIYPKRIHKRDTVRRFFEGNNLIPGRTILVSPFTYSISSLPDEFWVRLCDEIKKKGYSIAVNIGDETEKNMITDATSVHFDFMPVMDFMEYAGTVIGMRSGFFDITSQASCRRIILYPAAANRMVEWNSTDMDFCSLKAMGLCEDAEEIEICRDIDKTLDTVLKIL